eukprot:SAG31_NODE_24038_length_490_cov_1.189258_1_plen_83_part_10
MHTYLTGAVHATADNISGPYSFADVSVPGEIENPMSISDGTRSGVLIAFLDHGYPNGSAVNLEMPYDTLGYIRMLYDTLGYIM